MAPSHDGSHGLKNRRPKLAQEPLRSGRLSLGCSSGIDEMGVRDAEPRGVPLM
ncbi:MAG: hypothetical protein AAFU79_02380 [Myxococcota bacterium]